MTTELSGLVEGVKEIIFEESIPMPKRLLIASMILPIFAADLQPESAAAEALEYADALIDAHDKE